MTTSHRLEPTVDGPSRILVASGVWAEIKIQYSTVRLVPVIGIEARDQLDGPQVIAEPTLLIAPNAPPNKRRVRKTPRKKPRPRRKGLTAAIRELRQ